MQAIMEQAAIDQATLPNAAYDKKDHMITATVLVSLAAPNVRSFQTPPITLKGPQHGEPALTWTVQWSFGEDLTLAGASPVQYEILVLPTSTVQASSLGPDLWLFKIEPDTVTSLAAFSYDIIVSDPGIVRQIDDPTIVVTPDPIGN